MTGLLGGFVIPSLPASMNAIYQVIYSMKRVELKPDVRLWKNTAKQYINGVKVDPTSLLWIGFEFHGDWFTKAKTVRKVDLSNMVKVIQDVVAEKCGFDDSAIFSQRFLDKIQSEEKAVKVWIGELDENRKADQGLIV